VSPPLDPFLAHKKKEASLKQLQETQKTVRVQTSIVFSPFDPVKIIGEFPF